MVTQRGLQYADEMEKRFRSPVPRVTGQSPSQRRSVAGPDAVVSTTTMPGARSRTPGLGDVGRQALAKQLMTTPQVSRNKSLTRDQNAQLTRDSQIRTGRENQKIAAALMGEQVKGEFGLEGTRLRNQGSLAVAWLRNKGELESTQLRNQGIAEVAGIRNQGQLENTQLRNTGRLAEIDRQNQFTTERDATKNIYDRESDNRRLATEALTRGATGPGLENLYNSTGDFPADIRGITIPKETQSPYSLSSVYSGEDDKGNRLPDRMVTFNKQTGEIVPAMPQAPATEEVPAQETAPTETPQAPPQALKLLMSDPKKYSQFFMEKYGYLPEELQ